MDSLGLAGWKLGKSSLRLPLACLAVLLASGCALLPLSPTAAPTPTLTPRPTATPLSTATPHPTPLPTRTPEPPDTGWRVLQPGIELRRMLVEPGATAERVTIVRLNPATVRFRVHYDPITPRPVRVWAERLGSLLVINAGYFTAENRTVGVLISAGQAWGTPYGDFAGMFAVTPDEQVSVRWFRDRAYDPGEPLREAVQSFPVLVKPGGAMGFPADADDGRQARRTVVAQDRQGRILFVVAPGGKLNLHGLASFLASSDLDLDVALNLDGGTSTGLWLGTNVSPIEINSHIPVPSVISVDYP